MKQRLFSERVPATLNFERRLFAGDGTLLPGR